MAAAMPAMADLNGEGYYRVENYKTERWVSVIDYRGRIDIGSTSADLQAIKLQKNFDVVSGDAASVLYVKPVSGEYDITAQGTGIYEIIDHYLRLREVGSANGQTLYKAYGTYNGATRYLGDGTVGNRDLGGMSTATTGDYQKWYIKPITSDGENFFGVQSTVDANGALYASLYTSFPYSAYSDGVKFYYVNRTFLGAAELKEVDGTVAESTPVIVKCAGVNPSDNRLYVGGSGISMSDNCLSGTYFNCDKGGHENFTTYDPKTMRVPGRCADGSFGFITADIETIPANTAYLKVTPDAPSEVKIMSTEEFDLYYKYHTAVESVGVDSDESSDVYSATGILLHKNATPEQINSLPAGLYIIGGKKILKR